MPSIAGFWVARLSLCRKGNEQNGAWNGSQSYGMHGGRMALPTRLRGKLNGKWRAFALEHFRTRLVFDASGGKTVRGSLRFMAQQCNASFVLEASC